MYLVYFVYFTMHLYIFLNYTKHTYLQTWYCIITTSTWHPPDVLLQAAQVILTLINRQNIKHQFIISEINSINIPFIYSNK